MKLYDIKSRERRAISVQLTKEIGGHKCHEVTRVVRRVDRETGENRPRPETGRYPPVLRWGARETICGLPESVLSNPAIQAHIKAGRLIVVATTEVEQKSVDTSAKAGGKRKRR